MSPIQLTVLAGVLMLITAMNLKIAIWYLERKQAKQALQEYNNSEKIENESTVPFNLNEIKSVETLQKNMVDNLDLLQSKALEKIGIMKDDTLVAVMIPIEKYEKHFYASYTKEQHLKP